MCCKKNKLLESTVLYRVYHTFYMMHHPYAKGKVKQKKEIERQITSGYDAMQPFGASAFTSTSPTVRLGSSTPWKRPAGDMNPPAERQRATSAPFVAS